MNKLFLIFVILFYSVSSRAFAIEEIRLEEGLEDDIKLELDLDKPKKIIFKNGPINEFTPILNFQGVYDARTDENRSNFTYPFILEGGAELKFNENKDKIHITSNFSKNVDDLDNKFLGKLSDVYFERELNKNHRVLIGNSRIPIGMEGSQSQYTLLFTKRAQMSSSLGNARALGVRFRGNFGPIDYDLGGYSSTRHLQDISEGAEFAGQINYKPFYDNKDHILKDFEIGSGINTGSRGKGYTVANISTEYKYKKLYLGAEYAWADGSNSYKYDPNSKEGFYTTLAYNITEKLQIAGRYDSFDFNTKKANTTTQKYTAGLNYYVLKQRLRFSLDYTYTKNPNANDGRNSVRFMTQIMI